MTTKKRPGLTPLVGIALDSPVRFKKVRAKDLTVAKAKIKRTVERAPEVLVKISGGVRGAVHLKSHMDYITRNCRLEAETERGEVVDNVDALRSVHHEWSRQLGKTRANQRDTVNIVLSMPEGTDPEAVRRAARGFAKEQFTHHQYLMALHTPANDPPSKGHKGTKNPHVHLTVKSLGFDLTRLNPRKADLAEWRESFAEQMRQQGWDAEATPRRARGVILKPMKQIVWNLENAKGRPGSRAQAAKIKEAATELKQGRGGTANPYRKQIVETQKLVRQGWLDGANTLDASPNSEDKALAQKIRSFVASFPKDMQDERTKIKAALVESIEKKRALDRKPNNEQERENKLER